MAFICRRFWPTWADVVHGTEFAVLPQLPLTLTNAIIVTAAVARQLYPGASRAANERNLAITTGLGNLFAAPLGGYLMCHGAGGVTAHHRVGARSATAPLAIGLVLLALAVFVGEQAMAVLRIIPDAALGALLLFSGIELAQSSQVQRYAGTELFVILVVGAICVAINPALGFALGVPLAVAVERRWIRL